MAIVTGTDVAREREARGLTQELLATMAGVSVRSIRRAEGGQGVSAETLRCLAAALDVPFEPVVVREVDAVERARRRLSAPSTPVGWGVCVAQSGIALAFPVLITCLLAYPEYYAWLRQIHPGLAGLAIFFQLFGLPIMMGIAAHRDAASGKRVPTAGAAMRILCAATLASVAGLAVLVGYLVSISPEPVSWAEALGPLYGPLGPLAVIIMAFVTYRSTTAGELRYVAWRERFLYGEAGRT